MLTGTCWSDGSGVGSMAFENAIRGQVGEARGFAKGAGSRAEPKAWLAPGGNRVGKLVVSHGGSSSGG